MSERETLFGADVSSSAVLSDDRVYRYLLTRTWDSAVVRAKDGAPRHPLYLRSDARLDLWHPTTHPTHDERTDDR